MPSNESFPRRFGDMAPSRFPGERLGMPEKGTGSVGRAGRRMLALAIDWATVVPLSIAFFSYDPLATMLLFGVLQIVFIPTIGGSIGHRLVGLQVVALAGGWVGVWRPIVRTLLLVLLIPVFVWDSDQRGFHDKVAQTVLRKS